MLRLALQYGTPTTPLPPTALGEGAWALIGSDEAARRWEAACLARIATPESLFAPVAALSDRAALALFRRRAAAGPLALAGAALGALGLVGALLLARQGMVAAGFGGVLAAAASWRAAGMFGQLQRLGRPAAAWRMRLERAGQLVTDVAIVAVPVLGASDEDRVDAGFAALVLVGLVNLAECLADRPRWRAPMKLLTDRGTLVIALGAAAMADLVMPAAQILAVIALGLLLVLVWPPQLTRD